ncbi:MAG: type II secretion system F family protein [Dehalococcoidia bacterium]|nr:type II secretion system F family protein [Dehalococcoidia bacterium]
MPALVAFATGLTVFLSLFGLLYRTAGGTAIEGRLGGLRYSRPGREALPDPEAAFSVRVLKPLVANVSRRMNAILPSALSQRLETALTRGGVKIGAGQFLVIVALTAGVMPLVALALFASSGSTGKTLLMVYGGALGFGVYVPRIWLLGRIKRRQKEIWRSLPDAFDLITASVEAGLGIDAAFQRVIEKVRGPFAVELTRTMREVSMGRARRDAFVDMADRTGVEELRSLINSIVQAESMGISIGSVIRVQTGVIRVKRKQKAEEQAFKAPIKMVFPLVFFIFPSIMMVVGGPAIIQMKHAF